MGKTLNRRNLDFWFFAKIGIFLIFAIFLMYPFFSLFGRSFLSYEGEFTLDNFKTFFTYKYYYETLFRSLKVSASATIGAVIIGVPLAYITSRYNIWGKRIVNVMIIMSLLSPPFIGAYSWILLLGRNGTITRFLDTLGIHFPSIYGFWGIILVFTLKLYPYVYLYVSGALDSIDSSLEEAAENLGMSKWKRMMTVTFPVILPTIAAGAVMVFMSSLADFGTPMLIGEGYKVLPVLVYEEFMSEMGGNPGLASALSIIVVCCSLSVLLYQKRVVAKKQYTMSTLRPPKIEQLKIIPRVLLTLGVFIVTSITFLPQVVVVYTSFLKTNGPVFVKGFSLDSYQTIFYKLGMNIRNTFTYSTVAIVLIIGLGIIIAYLITKRRSKSSDILDILVMFPYVIPGAVLGIGLLLAFKKGPIVLAGTPYIMIIAYVIRKMPFTVRSSSAILQQVDQSVEEASINLGVSPMKSFFLITARLMLPGIVSGAILSWISTINELSSSIMLYTGKTATISVAIYTEVVRASFGTAAALASILTLATLLSFVLFSIISKGKVSVV
ncbi:iron ABC transporter permease [Erysipelothrix larvae]|uniref:Iron ABC transporter permease n=1 Tax=Erysipelothrix larvae TaxID=1514105 RepID=A0A0X8H0Y9_9FIRM|nr:iron ABC transporter permease [Erysipelothrix larvae]AMC94089.1 iron ABC transporter permease [Erysipelothrix larvae]